MAEARLTYDASEFAADVVLLGALVISIGIPLYHSYGFIGHPLLVGWYVISATLLPMGLPLLVWWLRWGPPSHEVARVMMLSSIVFALPVLVFVAALIYFDLDLILTGVSVMLCIAAILVAVVRGKIAGLSVRTRMLIARWVALLMTPVIVLGLTNALPHGLDAIQGWSLPVPVISAGAFGCIRGLARYGSRSAKPAA